MAGDWCGRSVFYSWPRVQSGLEGRTARHANRPILIEGDPLPAHLTRSSTTSAGSESR
jgi:hypothetical protein